MRRLLSFMIFIFFAQYLTAQKFHLEPAIGIGNFTNSARSNTSGKAYLFITPRYALTNKLSIGIDFISGGDFFPLDNSYLEEGEDYLILDPSGVSFRAIALNPEFKIWRKSLSYFYTGLGIGLADLYFNDGRAVGELQPGSKSNGYWAFELGYAYKEVRLSLIYQNYGLMDAFEGVTAEQRLILPEQNVRMLFLHISYNWDFSF